MRYRIVIAVFAALAAAVPLAAVPAKGAGGQPLRLGALFCSSGFPFEAEPFNGGIGAQAVKGPWLARAGLFFQYEKALTESFDWGARLFGGRYLVGSKARLYAGLFAGYSRSSEKTSVDEDTWTKRILDELGAGPAIGAELFLFESLSVFLDYELAFQATFPSEQVSAGGTLTRTKEDPEYFFGTRQGNSACIGICIYF